MMGREHSRYRTAADVGLAAALIVIAVGAILGEGDPEAMALAVIAVIVVGGVAYAWANTHDTRYRAAVGVALAAALVLFWGIGAVGLMGTDDEHPADLMYLVVPIVGILGSLIARYRPNAMARAMLATAAAQLLVPAMVVIAGLNLVPISLPQLVAFTAMLNGPFAAMYVGSGWLFRRAGRERAPVVAAGMG